MDIRDLETFLAVVRSRTLKAASEHLHLAQSSVSKRLQLLEQQCDIVLFERYKGGKKVTLTSAGERFVEIAERMLEMFLDLKRLTSHEYTMLSVGTVTSLHVVLMPYIFNEIMEHEPQMRLSARTIHSSDMYDAIDRKDIDIGFTFIQRAHPNVLVTECFSEPILVMQPSVAPSCASDTVNLEHLDFLQEISFPWTPYYESRNQQWSPTGHPRVFVEDPTMLVGLLRRPGQWAFVPQSIARHFQKMGSFKLSIPHPKPPDRVCYQITHKQPASRTSASLAIFHEYLENALGKIFGSQG